MPLKQRQVIAKMIELIILSRYRKAFEFIWRRVCDHCHRLFPREKYRHLTYPMRPNRTIEARICWFDVSLQQQQNRLRRSRFARRI